MNVYDSNRMRDIFKKDGYEIALRANEKKAKNS